MEHSSTVSQRWGHGLSAKIPGVGHPGALADSIADTWGNLQIERFHLLAVAAGLLGRTEWLRSQALQWEGVRRRSGLLAGHMGTAGEGAFIDLIHSFIYSVFIEGSVTGTVLGIEILVGPGGVGGDT